MRPIRERKVGASGTKGVGDGIGCWGMRAWRARVREGVVVVVRREVVARWAGRANIVLVGGVAVDFWGELLVGELMRGRMMGTHCL